MAEAVKAVSGGDGGRISRREIQEAIAKTVELRALHAALMQGNSNHSPANLKLLSASSQFPGHDYPVFTPSYEDEPLPISGHIRMASQMIPDNNSNNNDNNQTELVDHNHHICPVLVDDTKSVASSSTTNHFSLLQTASPGPERGVKSKRRTSIDDTKSVSSSCNKCKPATVMITTSTDHHNSKTSIVPLTDSTSHSSSQNKSRGTILSWILPRSKRKQKNNEGGGPISPLRAESEEVSQVLKDIGTVSIETLKKELVEANLKRDLAQKEASEMRSAFGDLKKKLEFLESHCEELKKALLGLSRREEFKQQDSLMPVSEDAMVEGFLQIVSEARLSMKQFCKTLFRQIDPNDETITNNINHLLTPYKMSLNSKHHPKVVLYHLSAIINQAFYQDFENCMFQRNGTPKSLNPHQERQQKFQSFVSLRNLSWNEVLNKGTKHYSEEFSRFCDQKMNSIVVTLNWTRQWPENLLQSFFVAAKCVWLLHLLAFSFQPPLMILRVEENRQFDGHYMEDVFKDKQRLAEGASRVKVMVMPGFYVQDRILRCKVLCRYKSAA